MTNGRITEDEVLLGETSKQVYKEVLNYYLKEGISPTQEELARKLGFTKRNVRYHLTRLSVVKLLHIEPKKIRGIILHDI